MYFIDKKRAVLYNTINKIGDENMKKTKAKKILSLLIILIFIIGGTVVINATTIENPTIIEFEDEVLFEMVKLELTSKPNNIRIQLNKDDNTIPELGIRLSEDDLVAREVLNLQGMSGFQITNLSGIERFTNLVELSVPGNAITNMETVTQLNSLRILEISGNDLSNTNSNALTTISKLTNLTTLDMSNTKIDSIQSISKLSNLKTLILSENNLNNLSAISGLTSITKLDISNNRSIPTIGHITTLKQLEELNISNTGLTTLNGVQNFNQLKKLYASNITGLLKDDDRLEALYSVDEETEEVLLKNLEVLDLSSSGITETTDAEGNILQKANQAEVDFKKLSAINTLKELYLENMGIDDLKGLVVYTNLKILDLANNKIDSDALEDIILEKDGVVADEDVLKATRIELQKNDIIDVSIFAKYPTNIEYLDLSENHVYDTTPLKKHNFTNLFLQNQDITFSIYDKAVEVDHYIILPEIFKSNKIEGSLVYSENQFTTKGLNLNPDYTEPSDYNVIISSAKTKSDTLNIKINGGNADGTVLTYVIGQSASSSDNGYVTESLFFNDEKLYDEMLNEIRTDPNQQDYAKYILDSFELVEKRIININRQVIDKMELLYFDNKSIKDITGLENCSKLTDLYLQANDISTIQPLEACTKITTLKLANNKDLGNNNTAIEKMSKLTYLDLSNTGMTNIDSINNLINSLKSSALYELVISGNGLQDITGLEKIKSLGKLEIANENLDNQDLSVIEKLTGLTTLDISGNQISDLTALTSLTNLKYLYFSNNEVESLIPLTGKIFTELNFTGNKVKDITPLSSHNSINKLYMDNNQIEDVTTLNNISIEEEFSVGGQKITRAISEEATGSVAIALPQIFKAAKTQGNKIYTNADLTFTNCELDSTGENIIIDLNNENAEIAKVEINGGKAWRTTLTIAIPLKADIKYSIPNDTPTNQDVTATITFNRSGVTIKNNDGNNAYTFTQNGQFTFEYYDEYGFEGTATAVVNNIDKVAPRYEETKTIVDKKVVVTIKADEEISEIQDWTISADKKVITKTYSEDKTEIINLVDKAGNTTEVKIEVKIDKTAPKITGVEDGKTYNNSVTPIIEDENLDTIELTKDGIKITNYKSGTEIKESGKYVLTAIDKFENISKVSFEIEISDIITSKDSEITVKEDELIIKNIQPKTTVSSLKQKIDIEMSYEIIDKNGKVITETSKIGTGYKIKMANNKEYTLVIIGDCNGDGNADLKDILAINKHRLNKVKLKNEYLIAGDSNEDEKCDLKDILRINKFRLGKINEL